MNPNIRKIITTISSPKFVVYTLPWLMVLLIFGTLAQRYIGLYDAQKMFFSSFFLWIGPVPLPGGYIATGIILLSLLTKLLFKSKYSLEQSGIIISHIGVLSLLFGGLFSAFASQEGYINLTEGNASNIIADYHQREFVIIKNEKDIVRIDLEDLHSRHEIAGNLDIPFKILVLDKCRNCDIIEARYISEIMRHDATKIKLEPKKTEQEDEENLSGVTFHILESGDKILDGIYITFENSRNNIKFKIKNDEFKIKIRKKEYQLPFTIYLKSFKRVLYPGTQTAKSYISNVIIKDNGIEWPVLIQMNEPLRYKGYTFYQSSFVENQELNISVLAVVRNAGAIFPYIACIILSVGLLIHIIIKLGKVKK